MRLGVSIGVMLTALACIDAGGASLAARVRPIDASSRLPVGELARKDAARRAIVISNLAGSSRHVVPTRAGIPRAVAWSPDGTKLAFSAGREIVIVNPAGGSRRVVSTHDSWASDLLWSPEGTNLAYQTSVRGGSALFVLDADTLASRLVLGPEQRGLIHTIWAPDGHALLVDVLGERRQSLYVAPADGSAANDLWEAHHESPFFDLGVKGLGWSPDSRNVLFLDGALDFNQWGYAPDPATLLIAPAAGGATIILARNVRRLGARGLADASWSPDGDHIVFTRCVGYTGALDPDCEAWLVRPDGSGLRLLPTRTNGRTPYAIVSPGVVWTPDGREVLYARGGYWRGTPSQRHSLAAVNIRTDRFRELARGFGWPRVIRLSSDGTKASYVGGSIAHQWRIVARLSGARHWSFRWHPGAFWLR